MRLAGDSREDGWPDLSLEPLPTNVGFKDTQGGYRLFARGKPKLFLSVYLSNSLPFKMTHLLNQPQAM